MPVRVDFLKDPSDDLGGGAPNVDGASANVDGASGKVDDASANVAGASPNVADASGKVDGGSANVDDASGKVDGAPPRVPAKSARAEKTAGRQGRQVERREGWCPCLRRYSPGALRSISSQPGHGRRCRPSEGPTAGGWGAPADGHDARDGVQADPG